MIIPKPEAEVATTESPLPEYAEMGGLPVPPVPGPASVAETKPNPKTGGGRLRLIALVKKEETIQALIKAMRLPTQATGPPERAGPEPAGIEAMELEWSGERESMDGPEYPDRRGQYPVGEG